MTAIVKPTDADDVHMPPSPIASPALFSTHERRSVRRFRQGEWHDEVDDLADEVPIALEFNGIAHVVMLASPADVEDFALGFALSEGILAHRGECYGIDVTTREAGITAHIEIASRAFAGLKARRRNLTGRTGCGLCGTESLDQVLRPLPEVPRKLRIARSALARAHAALDASQPLNQRTGAVHGAAWCTAEGDIVLFREDVGRHNALDKLIGAMAKAEIDSAEGFVLMTSRASVEIVQKSAQVGISLVAAISAATALAARTAQAAGITLIGFVRGAPCVVYSGSANVTDDGR